jgi:hypothetical protein
VGQDLRDFMIITVKTYPIGYQNHVAQIHGLVVYVRIMVTEISQPHWSGDNVNFMP